MTVIGIVGAGAVAQATAATISATNLAATIVVVSRTREQATALADDVQDQCTALDRACRIRLGTPAVLLDCDVVVVAARAPFRNTHRGDIRMAGLHANAALIAQLGHTLSGYRGTTLVVTNPVDVMSRLLAETSGTHRVYGIGSALDSARYRTLLAHQLDIPVTAITGHVIGEHGDAAVICTSTTTINGHPADINPNTITTLLHARPTTIRHGIGRVRAGAAGATVSALHKTLGLVDGIEELSTAYQDSWLGVPLHFTHGQPTLAMPPLNPTESAQFTAAQAKLRRAYDTVQHQTTAQPKEQHE